MIDLRGDLLAAIDFETTGRLAGFHEPCQVAVVPLCAALRPISGVRPFVSLIRPEYPERREPEAMRVHGIPLDMLMDAPSQDDVADRLHSWAKRLASTRLVPLAHNWAFEAGFLAHWLGTDRVGQVFAPQARDAMLTALAINDRAAACGDRVPFRRVGLDALARHFKIKNQRPHDAYWDALVEAEVFRCLLS